jgi:hypothetical protein
MLKLILKIWPAFIPLMVYVVWVYIIDRVLLKKFLKKSDTFEGEKVVGEKTTEVKKLGVFSLQNRCFVIILYMTFALGILVLITFAFTK